MNKANISTAERIAALEEQKDRLADRAALAHQMQVCAENRDALADMLNCAIDERDELRAKVTELEARVVELLIKNQRNER